MHQSSAKALQASLYSYQVRRGQQYDARYLDLEWRGTNYSGYNAANELTTVSGASLLAVNYDQNGNRTGGGYVTGADNRLFVRLDLQLHL